MDNSTTNLEKQREEFSKRRFLATPLSGTIVWLIIGIVGFFLPAKQAVWAIFIGTGSIVYIALFLSKFTGENLLDKSKPKNTFDTLFLMTVGMSVLVYAIAIPFFIVDYTSLPMTVGILTGLMWLPFSWIIQHWIGLFHAITRTILVTAAWYIFPNQRFFIIPIIVVAIYAITIYVLENRWRNVNKTITK